MRNKSANREKIRYWEGRLIELLRPLPITSVLKLSWGLEIMRSGDVKRARTIASFPGEQVDHQIAGKFFIPPWSVDALINESFRVGTNSQSRQRHLDLRNWQSIARLCDTYNSLSNHESVSDYDSEGVVGALQRLFWPQYDWQLGYENSARIARAWNSYVTEESRHAFFEKYEVELDTFIQVSFGVYAATQRAPNVKQASLMMPGITYKDVCKVGLAIGSTIEGHIEYSKSIRDNSVPRDFRRSTIKERPLVKFAANGEQCFFVPSRDALLRRITDGLYYDVVHDEKSRNRSGAQFENLCQRLIEHFADDGDTVSGEIKTSFGMSVDILQIRESQKKALLFECKSRRLPSRILTSADPWGEFQTDYNDLAKGIVQIWRSNDELMKPKDIDAVGLVALYDPWTIMGISFLEQLFKEAHEIADKKSIAKESRIPVALISYFELERTLKRYDLPTIHVAVGKSQQSDKRGFELDTICEEIVKPADTKETFDYASLIRSQIVWWPEAS